MDWRDEASQRLRFAVLLEQLGAGGSFSLLDVGCGNGELLACCRARGLDVTYLGIDVCPEMVAACRRRFGRGAATLAVSSDLDPAERRFDFVVASGTFNVKLDVPAAAWRQQVLGEARQMLRLCRTACAFNLMSARARRRYRRLCYFTPAQAASLAAATGAGSWNVREDYPLFELTVTLREPGGGA